MADRVAVMYCGRIVEQAPVTQLLESPMHPYTRGLLASVPGGRSGERLVSIPGSVPQLGRFGEGCPFAPRCPDRFDPCEKIPPDVTAASVGHDVRCHLYTPVTSGGPERGR
jgi:peptide/nickel transport system ATP-binding protein